MAITYNGTAITSATWDGTTYKNISYDGCIAYSNTCLCHFTDMGITGVFGGFERKICSGCYYLRAKYWLCPYANGCTYMCWIGGKRANSFDELPITVYKMDYVTCTSKIICGCGSVCGQTYRFPITHDPISLGTTCSCIICSCDDEISAVCVNWLGSNGFIMYSDWVRVCYCDYMYGTICLSGIGNICHPVLRSCALRYGWKNLCGGTVWVTCPIQGTTTCYCEGTVNTTLC